MTSPDKRRPWPALVFLVILTLLAAVVWWRVLERDKPKHHPTAAKHTTKSTPVCPSTPPATPPTVLPVPSKITVRVLNSTERAGIAAAATKLLKTDGFKTEKAQNDSVAYGGTGKEVIGVAQIRYEPAQLGAATLLSYYFPRATMKVIDSKPTSKPTGQSTTKSTGQSTTVLISLGSTYRKPATKIAVRRQLKAAHLRVRAVVPPADVPTVPAGC
jgi:LytR cell envelope-related transcriptional attenuator